MVTGTSEAYAGLHVRHVIKISVQDTQLRRTECSAIVANVSGSGESRAAARASCRVLAATLYELETGRMANQLQICHDRSGAPRIRCEGNSYSYRVSLSHSGDWVAVALSSHVDVGIDVEQIDRTRPTDKFGAFLGWNGNLSDPVAFYNKWTLWEACFKAVQGRALTECEEAFRSLDDSAGAGAMAQANGWASFRDCWEDTISYTLVTRDDPIGAVPKSLNVQTLVK